MQNKASKPRWADKCLQCSGERPLPKPLQIHCPLVLLARHRSSHQCEHRRELPNSELSYILSKGVLPVEQAIDNQGVNQARAWRLPDDTTDFIILASSSSTGPRAQPAIRPLQGMHHWMGNRPCPGGTATRMEIQTYDGEARRETAKLYILDSTVTDK